MIVGIASKKQSDIDAASNWLQNCGFYGVSFLHTVKLNARIAMRNAGMTQAQIDDAIIHHDHPMPILGKSYAAMTAVLRKASLEICPDFLTLCAERELDALGSANCVVEDIYSENEAYLIRNKGGLIIHIISAGNRATDHGPASSVMIQPGDAAISNNGSAEGLFDRMRIAIDDKFRAAA